MEVRLHDGTVVTVPPDGITLGRGSPACWTDPAISRQQAQLLPVQGIQDLLKLKNMGMNGTRTLGIVTTLRVQLLLTPHLPMHHQLY